CNPWLTEALRADRPFYGLRGAEQIHGNIEKEGAMTPPSSDMHCRIPRDPGSCVSVVVYDVA
ncbi:MAG: hypothetical protein Q4C02_05520, partial [Eubacteriales bacterium]|nr:hypothetical protein [Eubacteriales bacterium]